MTQDVIEGTDCYPLTPRGLLRATRASGSLPYSAPSLLFLAFVLIPVVLEPSAVRIIGVTILLPLFAVLFIGAAGIRHYGVPARYGWLAALWIVVLAFAGLLHSDALFLVMFVLMAHAIALPWKAGRVAVVVIALVTTVLGIAFDQPVAILLAVVGTVMALGIGAGIQKEVLEARIQEVQERNAVLAVAAERERIGRDLHDILGHSLTTITVSAQLADRLVDADPDAARAQIREIERISRQSLADVRTTASGMQQVRAATEVASARAVLTAAGVEAEVPTALPTLDEDCAELFGYVVREGVTNVVRHAQATRCRIEVGEDSCSVADDGVGIPPRASRTGLAGLASRVEEAGGVLDVHPGSDGHGTVLEARMEP